MADIHDMSALEQGAAIRDREISSLELVDHYLARIGRLSDGLGAFVTVTAAGARDRAAAPVEDTGPLAGVPTAIKDLSRTAGVRTTFGSAIYADFVPETSDEVVQRIEGAGLISLGKTSVPEFGSPPYTEPAGMAPAVTPWDVTRMAGASSGGAGTAVAAGLTPLAHGSDGGGSIRIPASCCGLVGLKPSRGRVSNAPMYGDPMGLATDGPIARTVRDAAAFLDVMEGRAVGDPFWAPAERESFLAACDREPGRLRIARFSMPADAAIEVAPACLQAWEEASGLLESLGHDVIDIATPMPSESVALMDTCWAVLASLSTTRLSAVQKQKLRPLTRWLGEWGGSVSAPEFGLAMAELRRAAARALAALAPFDAVLSPTLATLPLPVGAIRDDLDPAKDIERQKQFSPFAADWNVTGMPAISLPLHQTAAGLPVGVTLGARPAEEALLVSLASQVEAAAPWRQRHPPCW